MDLRVVLVDPLYGGNVGSVARAMKNFGFHDLVLVNPPEIGGEARAMASHARDILESARTVDTLGDAIGGSLAVGTTGMSGEKEAEHIRMPALTPRELRDDLQEHEGVVSLVLGREDQGLSNEELALCEIVVSIPTSKEYPVMNLSHAATIILYELSNVRPGNVDLASHEDIDCFIEHLDRVLRIIDYREHKREKTLLMCRRILGRAVLTSREVSTLHGILRGCLRAIHGKR